MTRPKSIFAGMKLTEQTPLAPGVGPDQRLFTRPPADQDDAVPEGGPQPPAPEPVADAAAPPRPTVAPPSALAPNLPRKVGTKEPTNLGSKEDRNVGPAERKKAAAPPAADPSAGPFDISVRPGHQANFLFTDEELDALDDLKRDAKRRYGFQTTKQDLVRYAVLDLLNDYLSAGDQSRVIQWLRRRRPQDR